MKPHYELHIIKHAVWGVAYYVRRGDLATFLFSDARWAIHAAGNHHWRRRFPRR